MSLRSLVVAGLAVGALACGGSTEPTSHSTTIARVHFAPDHDVVQVGRFIQLNATAFDAEGDTLPTTVLHWRSADTSIATVSATGRVLGRGVGTVQILAGGDGVEAPATVDVLSAEIFSLTATPGHDTVYAWEPNQLVVTPRDSAGHLVAGLAVTWQGISDGVTIDSAGRATATTPGPKSATALVANSRAAVQWYVKPTPVASVELTSTDTLRLRELGTKYDATLRDAAGHVLGDRAVTWHSSDETVATVSDAGYVTARAAGRVTITATSEGVEGTRPFRVQTLTFRIIATGGHHSCGLTTADETYCWGTYDLDWGTGTPRVVGGGAYRALALGENEACGLDANDGVACWGHPSGAPSLGGVPFRAVAAGYQHACALASSGQAFCWGLNSFGQLGTGVASDAVLATPVAAAGALRFSKLVAGVDFTCGLATDAAVYCWGRTLLPGADDTVPAPTNVSPGTTFRDLATGYADRHACALTTDGRALCWGSNAAGQLGTGSRSASRSQPVAVAGGMAFAELAVGGDLSCGLTAAGELYCWGAFKGDPQPDGAPRIATTPTLFGAGHTWSAVSLSTSHGCGLAAGIAYCWGDNYTTGQLGTGDAMGGGPAPMRVIGQP